MAVILEEAIRDWMTRQQRLREQIAEGAADRFIAAIGGVAPPTQGQLDRAAASVRDAVYAALTADAVLDSLPNAPPDGGAREALRSSWLSLNPAWGIPGPPPGRGLSTQRLAVAAAVGSLLGMMVLGGLLNLMLGLRGVGMLVGAPGGGAAAMYAVGKLAESKTLRFVLKALMGVAWTADLLGATAFRFGAIWGRLAGFGVLRRVLVYVTVVSLLAFTRGSAQYDTGAYRSAVRDAIRQAVDFSSLLLCALSAKRAAPSQAAPLDAALARAIQGLHRADGAGLPMAAEAVLLEAQRLGLDGVSVPPRFIQSALSERPRLRWSPELAQQYRPFGLIEEGDTVIVEDDPVIMNGSVLEKGRVRKQRA
jgi:hypothetical protein